MLVCSDGKPVGSWAVQPTVCLAIASAVTNILLHFAVSEGAKIYWWRHSMKPDTNVGQLHRNWANGNSLWESITSGRQFNLMAAACILVAITPINGPLLQRASGLGMAHFPGTTSLSLYAAKQIPNGYTGWLSGRAETCSILTSEFLDTVNAFTRGSPINVTDTGCHGTCRTTLKAAGFATNCSSASMDYHLSYTGSDDPDGYHVGPETLEGTQAFISNFRWRGTEPESIYLGMQFKNTADCDGTLQIRNCTLRAATMEYDVVIDSNTSSIALDPRTTIFDDRLVGLQDIPYVVLSNTTLGGLWRALSNAYDSTARLRFVGAVRYELSTEGATTARHAILQPPETQPNPATDCSMRFTNPTDELLAASRELIFRTAIAAASWSDLQTVSAEQVNYTLVHKSQYLFLGLALLVTASAILLVLPTFHNYWTPGRKVSMSPLEIAKAFMAPKLAAADPNSTAEQLVEKLGQTSMVYGIATSLDGERRRLGMQDTQRIDAPVRGVIYHG